MCTSQQSDKLLYQLMLMIIQNERYVVLDMPRPLKHLIVLGASFDQVSHKDQRITFREFQISKQLPEFVLTAVYVTHYI